MLCLHAWVRVTKTASCADRAKLAVTASPFRSMARSTESKSDRTGLKPDTHIHVCACVCVCERSRACVACERLLVNEGTPTHTCEREHVLQFACSLVCAYRFSFDVQQQATS